jgi:hypothetical protein
MYIGRATLIDYTSWLILFLKHFFSKIAPDFFCTLHNFVKRYEEKLRSNFHQCTEVGFLVWFIQYTRDYVRILIPRGLIVMDCLFLLLFSSLNPQIPGGRKPLQPPLYRSPCILNRIYKKQVNFPLFRDQNCSLIVWPKTKIQILNEIYYYATQKYISAQLYVYIVQLFSWKLVRPLGQVRKIV